ncbi:hypothetical protein GLUCOINTEAF2_0200725 [Komagataeibacter intermedius AF2]|uniref:Uncharacterized protein n=1 Tax=Komagataeibacter intermedius AF2 TaxID=1458464 RepID=A0A0N0MFI4_9PROT|nr:hypothetical protein GLUCOINTEAF2_0200725 [Komagataeibacter intermedius AF2]
MAEQRFTVRPVGGERAYADGTRNGQRVLADLKRTTDGFQKRVGDFLDPLAFAVGHHHHEFIPARAADNIIIPGDGADAACDFYQELVRIDMAQRVVDVAETVDVQHEDRQRPVARLGNDVLHHPVQRAAVQQAGQGIIAGKLGQVRLGGVLFQRQRAERQARSDQTLRPCAKLVGFAQVQRENARHPPVARQHRGGIARLQPQRAAHGLVIVPYQTTGIGRVGHKLFNIGRRRHGGFQRVADARRQGGGADHPPRLRVIQHQQGSDGIGDEGLDLAADQFPDILYQHVAGQRLQHVVLQDQDLAALAFLRDVFHHAHVIGQLPAILVDLHLRQGQFAADVFAIRTREFHFARRADNAVMATFPVAVDVAVMFMAQAHRHQAVHVAAHDIGARDAPQGFRSLVIEYDLVILADDDRGVDRLLQRGQQDFGGECCDLGHLRAVFLRCHSEWATIARRRSGSRMCMARRSREMSFSR